MGSKPKISVCILTYNREKYLAECLSSILNQTFLDFEVIVSDDCSADATAEVMRGFTDPRVRYVRNDTHIGVFPNMNRCLELATGEYVCILHDDDLYAPRFLELEAAMLDRHPSAAFVHCAVYVIDVGGTRRRMIRAYSHDCLLDGKQEFLRYLGGHNVCCSTVMVRRDLYRRAGAFDTDLLCSDWLMWLQLALHGDVAYLAEPLVAMRVHAITISSSIEPSRWCWEFLNIAERGFRLAEAADPSLLRSREDVMRGAVRTQGKRFFIAAMAAITDGAFSVADGYLEVLRELEQRGLPRAYRFLAQMLRNRIGREFLFHVRRLRRARAAAGLPLEAAR